MRRWLFVLLLGLLPFAAWAEVPVPPLEKRVTDLTATLSAEQQAAIDARLAAFEQRKGSQVALLIVPTTQPEDIAQFGIRVAEQWKLGRKGIDDGVLLLVAKDDRALRIEVGYGLEGALNDATAKRIIEEFIVPAFKQGDFAGGLNAGIDRILGVIDGEPLPAPQAAAPPKLLEQAFPLLAFGTLFLGGLLRAMLGGFVGGLVTGGLAAGLVWLLGAGFFFALIAGFVVFIITLAGVSAGVPTGRGGSSGGGFGGGGFGGGGGGFGGGGASGRW